MQCYLAEKVHCVWLVNGEMKVLFEYKQPDGRPGQLMSGPINLVINKGIDTTVYIQHGSYPAYTKNYYYNISTYCWTSCLGYKLLSVVCD